MNSQSSKSALTDGNKSLATDFYWQKEQRKIFWSSVTLIHNRVGTCQVLGWQHSSPVRYTQLALQV